MDDGLKVAVVPMVYFAVYLIFCLATIDILGNVKPCFMFLSVSVKSEVLRTCVE